jgi:DNA-binding NarL/FixJ family response regulator
MPGAGLGLSLAQQIAAQHGGQIDIESQVDVGTAVTPFPTLTDRERELLTLIAQGLSNTQIASQLHISSKTVGNHISNIFNKLQVADRAQAIVKAREAGLGRASE